MSNAMREPEVSLTPDEHIELDEIVREEYPGGSEKFGRAIPGCTTMIAEPASPQENMIVPDEPGATWVVFAVRVVGPVPQFATRIWGSRCVDSNAKATGIRTSANSIDPTTK